MHPSNRQAVKAPTSDSASRPRIVTPEGKIDQVFRERVIEGAHRKSLPYDQVLAAVEGILKTWRDDPDGAARELDVYLDG